MTLPIRLNKAAPLVGACGIEAGPFEVQIKVSATADVTSGGHSERSDLLDLLVLSNFDAGRGKSTSKKEGSPVREFRPTRRRLEDLVYSFSSSDVFPFPCEWEERDQSESTGRAEI